MDKFKIIIELLGFILWSGSLGALRQISKRAWGIGILAGVGVAMFSIATFL